MEIGIQNYRMTMLTIFMRLSLVVLATTTVAMTKKEVEDDALMNILHEYIQFSHSQVNSDLYKKEFDYKNEQDNANEHYKPNIKNKLNVIKELYDEELNSPTNGKELDNENQYQTGYSDNDFAREWLKIYDKEATAHLNKETLLDWQYNTNVTEENSKASVEYSQVVNKWLQTKLVEARKFHNISDPDLKRQLKLITTTAEPKDPVIAKNIAEVTKEMESIFAQGKLEKNGKKFRLIPELDEIMAKSRDYDELLWAWRGWRDKTGRLMRGAYSERVQLENMAAVENGYKDNGEYLRQGQYEMEITDMVNDLFEAIKPVYEELHAYVRRKLRGYYPEAGMSKTSPIPAHLLGNMWAQDWTNIYDILIPYPEVASLDGSKWMKEYGFSSMKMVETAEEFFTSIGLDPMTNEFWENSMFTRPKDREVECYASAEDFSTGSDYRIKMCIEVNMDDLETIHHEMGHVEYFMAYAHQPVVYRDGANPGFHEAVGDTIALSVMTPTHMEKIQSASNGEQANNGEHADNKVRTHKYKQMINFLFKIALKKIVFLPFALHIDSYRWDIYNGRTNTSNYNVKWWNSRLKYQGISPPIPRTEEDFDAGSKYHVAANVPYIRYFFSHLLQFMFHEALCKEAGFSGPLYECDIYQSKTAGQKLKDMLSMGLSKPWKEALGVITGKQQMDASSVMKYFQPLIKWLKEDNVRHNETPGWDVDEQTYRMKIDDGGLYPVEALESEILDAIS